MPLSRLLKMRRGLNMSTINVLKLARKLGTVIVAALVTIILLPAGSSFAQGPNAAWTPTGPMTTTRTGASAALLFDGRVLITGGAASENAPGALSSAEVYAPSSGAFSP